MTQLFIQLAQTVTGAVITIVLLLLVAVMIGYITAWYYGKSVYSPVIKGLESDKYALKIQVDGLKEDMGTLVSKVEKLNDKITRLEEESSEKDKMIKKLTKSKKKQKLDV
jgi:peptidoglycan hydrolase CwlO-like protein